MDDREIIDLFLARSEEAFLLMEQEYGRLLFSRAEKILGSSEDAQECVNDTYLALWNTIPPTLPDSLPAYACRILRNQALKKLRFLSAEKRKAETYNLCLEEIAPFARSCVRVEDEIVAAEISKAVTAYLEKLSPNDRGLYVRHFSLLESYSELSAWSGLSQSALRTRMSRILKGLKKHLKKEGLLD